MQITTIMNGKPAKVCHLRHLHAHGMERARWWLHRAACLPADHAGRREAIAHASGWLGQARDTRNSSGPGIWINLPG